MPRSYSSPARERKRLATRNAVLDAAHLLFERDGFHGVTIGAVAAAAGVSAETVYATFGSKRDLLREVVRRAAFGDRTAIVDGDRIAVVLAEHDQRRRWALLQDATQHVLRRTHRLGQVVRAAAMSDPEIALLWQELERERRRDVRSLVRLLADAGPLRVPEADAVDLVWAISRSTDLYASLVGERRWSDRRAFLAVSDAIARAILPD